ncbi:pyridoxamine 5'-phosphate oxidase-related FMN-binding protein [Globomyces pollinis-pini]|nr:pyridoxamine 5'-phosphate oxidase-related FMN-binding protein [Globomyces pollinis-pini]
MVTFFDHPSEDHLQWISQQKMFFIASASCKSNTRVNVSPKGYESIKVSQSNVYFLDLTGSGAETITHVNENQRLTFMFCAFEGSPRIYRIWTKAKVIYNNSPDFNQLLNQYFPDFSDSLYVRSIIVGDIIQSAHSCGFGVPFYEYVGPRDTLNKYWSAKDQMYITDYWKAKNTKSVDGLYVHGYPNFISRLLSMKYESSLVIGGIAIGVLLGMKLSNTSQ